MDERGAARIGGQATNPGGTERLHEYWVHGEGAGKIRWGTHGDFQRCVDHLGKYIRDPQGYCNLAHHAALGIYPATHAKEMHAGRAELKASSVNDLPDSAFAYIEPGGSKDASGRTVPALCGTSPCTTRRTCATRWHGPRNHRSGPRPCRRSGRPPRNSEST